MPVPAGCNVEGCDRPAKRNGKCWTHAKRAERGMPVNVVVPERPRTPFERVAEASISYLEADGDDDFRRARDNFRKSIAAAAPTLRSEVDREMASRLVREGLARRKAVGLRLGRPSKVHPVLVQQMVDQVGGVAKAARVLRVSVSTVFRALRRIGQKLGDYDR